MKRKQSEAKTPEESDEILKAEMTDPTDAPVSEEIGRDVGDDREALTQEIPQEDEVSEKDREIADLKDRYMRLLAEYDNFRKRSRAERENIYADALLENAKEWLLVVDNIDRAMDFASLPPEGILPDGTASGESVSEAEILEKVASGVALIQKQAQEVLAKLGIEEIAGDVGDSFDPNFHSAVAHIEDDSFGEQTIFSVFQKGYKKGDRVIRYSLVQVAN